jgi:Kef-type K+ transport system membrane component KefB
MVRVSPNAAWGRADPGRDADAGVLARRVLPAARVGLLCGAITRWLGIHAILGFFPAGTMAGSASGLGDDLRDSFSDTTHALFVPLFVATLALEIDVLAGLERGITALFTAVAVGGKFIGARLGARLAGVERGRATLMGAIFVPGGAMEIVVAALALELQLIDQRVFVAIVSAAVAASVVAGPLIGRPARRLGLVAGPPGGAAA